MPATSDRRRRHWALDIANGGFLINGPLLTLLLGLLDAGFLPGFSASKSLSAPTGHLMPILFAWVPNATCFPASAKGQRLGSDLGTRAGRRTWVFMQDGPGRSVSTRRKGRKGLGRLWSPVPPPSHTPALTFHLHLVSGKHSWRVCPPCVSIIGPTPPPTFRARK